MASLVTKGVIESLEESISIINRLNGCTFGNIVEHNDRGEDRCCNDPENQSCQTQWIYVHVSVFMLMVAFQGILLM
jgi:hypothetical protein